MNPFIQGLIDGLKSPDSLESGMTYPNPKDNEEYDHGVNIGQAIGKYLRSHGD